MITITAIILTVVLIGFICFYSIDVSVENHQTVQLAQVSNLKDGRVQGIYNRCSDDKQINPTESILFNKNCSKGPPINWNAIACSKNLTANGSPISIIASTKLSSEGEFCGNSYVSPLICKISANFIAHDINNIQNDVTKEVFDDLTKKFQNNFTEQNTEQKIGIGFCLTFNIGIVEKAPGYFIVKRLNFSTESTVENKRIALVSDVINKISDGFRSKLIRPVVTWRLKSPGSIKLKMMLKNLTLDQLNDIIGIRILVSTEQECYTVLDIIHSLYDWDRIKFNDYIKNPKRSSYQSLHTILIGDRSADKTVPGSKFHTRIEVQIRTFQMHYNAEYGVAAHSNYKKNQTEQVAQAQNLQN